MKIDGKGLANKLLQEIKEKVKKLKQKGITPTLAVIQVGDDEGSAAYIRQKELKAKEVGIKLVYKQFPAAIAETELTTEIRQLNTDSHVHGIIVQRPLPIGISANELISHISPEKDIDGFREDSKFDAPVALAVLHVLLTIYSLPLNTKYEILNTKKIVIIGKGQTAGAPIARTFTKHHISFVVLDSKSNPRNPLKSPETLQSADIIISCVGKGRVVTKEMIKPGVIMIGVGIHRVAAPPYGAKKIEGDYEEEEIKDIAASYTPTPGGIGPLTVAFLLKNLLFSLE